MVMEYEFLPEDISGLTSDELDEAATKAQDAYAALRAEAKTPDDLANLLAITADMDRIKERKTELAAEQAEFESKLAALDAQMSDTPGSEEPGGSEGEGEGTETPPEGGEETPAPEGEPAPEAVAAGGVVVAAEDVLRHGQRINIPWKEFKARQAKLQAEAKTEQPPIAEIVAAANVPGHPLGGPITSMRDISLAASARTRVMPEDGSAGLAQIASITRGPFPQTLSDASTPEDIEMALNAATDPEVLLAAGGWCAPSVVFYDFFNISCAQGLLDLPTMGIERGGVRFPASPSIADVLSTIWLWTESDDILAVTGTGTKPCARPACPTFSDERLDCHGLCVTAGNLTERAYPELIDNFIRLTMNGHAHVMSQRHIAELVAGSTAVSMASGTASELSASWGVLNSLDLQVVDYKLKYRMCDDDVLEAVFPYWIRPMIRADIAKRNGYASPFQVTEEEINSWFDLRRVRAQYVQDWQVGSGSFPGQTTARTDWPSAVQYLLFAAGTWVRGAGPTIDLGVQRDSTLNAKNDHTAAWTEECNLIAKFGHESRLVTVAVDTAGVTGLQADISDHP